MATVRTLLNNALYLSSMADAQFSDVEENGTLINMALNRLQSVSDSYRDLVPYLLEKTLVGEDSLLNIGAATIDNLRYIIGSSNVTYPMTQVSQENFARRERITDLKSIPEVYWHDKANDLIRIYPLRISSGDRFLMGYLPILSASRLDEELPEGITAAMQLFLEYEIAQGLCDLFEVSWTPQKEASRVKYLARLKLNKQTAIGRPAKIYLKGPGTLPVPYLAYISGNTPNG